MTCPTCKSEEIEREPCPRCKGAGGFQSPGSYWDPPEWSECEACEGMGGSWSCENCGYEWQVEPSDKEVQRGLEAQYDYDDYSE